MHDLARGETVRLEADAGPLAEDGRRRIGIEDLPDRVLTTLLIQSVAVIAQPIATSAGTAFVQRHITAGRTCTVIVMHAIERWPRSVIDGVEHWRPWHNDASLVIPEGGGYLFALAMGEPP